MSTQFDPYFEWFDIAIEEHPINYYRLLDLNRFESRPEVIAAALERQIYKVIEFLNGEHETEAKKVLEELRIAGRVLLDEEAKLKYDIGLDPKRAPKPKPVLDPNARLQPKPEPEPEPEPASVLKEDEKPKAEDAPKPPLPTLTKKRPPQPKPPILTQLPPGAFGSAIPAQNVPKPPVQPPPTPVAAPQPVPATVPNPIPVGIAVHVLTPEQVSVTAPGLEFTNEEPVPKPEPELDFDEINAKNNRTIIILGLLCGFLLVMVSVLVILQFFPIGKKPVQVAQTVSEKTETRETEEAKEKKTAVTPTEEESEAEETLEVQEQTKRKPNIPFNGKVFRRSETSQTPENPIEPLPQKPVSEVAENEEETEGESIDFETIYTEKRPRNKGTGKPENSIFEESPQLAETQHTLKIGDQQFCAILSQKLGLTVKLPTEAQWEYACRAGSNTPYNTGMNITVQLANIQDSNVIAPIERPVPCGSYPPNAWGIHDMHGNVSEWCQDLYLQGYYKISPKVDPPGPEKGKAPVYRGGSWRHNSYSCRSGDRKYGNFSRSTIGFRFIIIQE